MKSTTTLRLAALLGVVAFAGTAQAQSPVSCSAAASGTTTFGRTASGAAPACDVGDDISATVEHVLLLDIGTPTSLGSIGKDKFDSTAAAPSDPDAWPWIAGPSLLARGNRPFQLKIRAEGTQWAFSPQSTFSGLTSDPAKPVGDLAYLLANDGTEVASGFTPLTSSDVTLFDQTGTGARISKQMQYRTAWHYDKDIPGDYTLTVVYTIVGQ